VLRKSITCSGRFHRDLSSRCTKPTTGDPRELQHARGREVTLPVSLAWCCIHRRLALLPPRLDGRPKRRRWCLASPASDHDFVCELGHVTRRPVCARHTPINGRPINRDLWHCLECPVIAPEGQIFLSAWDEERRKAELLAQPVRWFHYMSDADHRRRTRGREREGHLLTIGREPKAWGRTVWIVSDDCWSDRLFVTARWDPDDPERSYSLEEWQGAPPAIEPVDAARYYGDRDWYECDQHFGELGPSCAGVGEHAG